MPPMYRKTPDANVGARNIVGRKRKRMSNTVRKPSQVLSDYPIIIHGEPGVGKTTLVGQFPDVYFFMFDPNDSYALHSDVCENWQDFIDLQEEFMRGEHKFRGCSIDDPRVAYEYAMIYAGNRYGFEHPGGQNDYGQSWSKVKQTFTRPLQQLKNSKYGFIVSCHSHEKEIETLSGQTYQKIAPDLSGQAYAFLVGQIYNVWYYHYVGAERWLQIIGDEHVVAKNRMKGHFLTKGGEPIYKIPMGNSEEESYKNLIRAFDNQQEVAYKPTFKQDSLRSTFTNETKKTIKKVKKG